MSAVPPPASSSSCSSASVGPQLQAPDRSVPRHPSSKLRIRVMPAAPQLQALDPATEHQAQDQSDPCSTPTARAIVFPAGPKQQPQDQSDPCGTSAASARWQFSLSALHGSVPCRAQTPSSRSKWSPPDLNHELQISVRTAGPQPRAPDLSGHCRTSTASLRSQWALCSRLRSGSAHVRENVRISARQNARQNDR